VYIEGDLLRTTSEQIDRLFREHLDEVFDFRLPGDYPEGEPVFRGRGGVDQLVAMLSETWSEWQFEPERFLDAGAQVVVFARIVGRGKASGAPFELETTTCGPFGPAGRCPFTHTEIAHKHSNQAACGSSDGA
jgi:hypothetical protein